MRKPTILLLLCLTLFACKKEKNKPYSFWTVNGKEFKTNETQVYYGKAAIEFRSSVMFPNGFFIYFQNTGSFPNRDSILMDSTNNPLSVGFDIIFNDTGYIPDYGPAAYLYKRQMNGHTQFELIGNWLYNSYRPNEDSVWATGIFVVP